MKIIYSKYRAGEVSVHRTCCERATQPYSLGGGGTIWPGSRLAAVTTRSPRMVTGCLFTHSTSIKMYYHFMVCACIYTILYLQSVNFMLTFKCFCFTRQFYQKTWIWVYHYNNYQVWSKLSSSELLMFLHTSIVHAPDSAAPIWDFLEIGEPYWLGEGPTQIWSPVPRMSWFEGTYDNILPPWNTSSNCPIANNLPAAPKPPQIELGFPDPKYENGRGRFENYETSSLYHDNFAQVNPKVSLSCARRGKPMYHNIQLHFQAYFGGLAECLAESEDHDPKELVCGGCSNQERKQVLYIRYINIIQSKLKQKLSVYFFIFLLTWELALTTRWLPMRWTFWILTQLRQGDTVRNQLAPRLRRW